jgi:hypothetical protein
MEEIEIDLDDETLFQLMLEAHRRDITFNKLVEEILLKEIEKHESKSPPINDR